MTFWPSNRYNQCDHYLCWAIITLLKVNFHVFERVVLSTRVFFLFLKDQYCSNYSRELHHWETPPQFYHITNVNLLCASDLYVSFRIDFLDYCKPFHQDHSQHCHYSDIYNYLSYRKTSCFSQFFIHKPTAKLYSASEKKSKNIPAKEKHTTMMIYVLHNSSMLIIMRNNVSFSQNIG